MGFRNNWHNNRWLQYTSAACIAVVLFVALTHINSWIGSVLQVMGLISPVIYGVVIAYLITPLVNHLQKTLFRTIRNETARLQLANITAIFLVLIVLVFVVSGVVPQLIDSVSMFISNFNSYAETLQRMLGYVVEKGGEYNLDLSFLDSSAAGMIGDFINIVTNNLANIAVRSMNVAGVAMNLGFGLILAVYFLVYKLSIIRSCDRLLSAVLDDKSYKSVTDFLAECNRIASTYVVSDILDGMLICIINAVFMMITGMPYVMIISLVVGIFNLIPTFGPFIGAFIGGVILLFASTSSVLPFIIFTFTLQMVDGYIIKPRLFAGALGVSGVWITVGIVVGGKLFGFIGMLLTVPFVAILNHLVMKYLERKEAEKLAEDSGGEHGKDGTGPGNP